MMPDDDRFPDLHEVPAMNDDHEVRTLAAVVKSAEEASPWSARVMPCVAEWFSTAPGKRDWLLRDGRTDQSDGVLPLGKVGLLIGEGGVSKTMALIALAVAVATGTPWLGAYNVATQGRVLVLLGEEDVEEVHRRCYNVTRAVRVPAPEPGSIVVLPLAGVPCSMVEADEYGNAVDAPFLTWLRSYVRAHGPFALVIVDPLSRFAGADAEIDNAAATRFVQALESIATETGATVIVAHHTNKTARGAGAPVSGASARGSSAIYDGVRWAAALSAERVPCEDADTAARLGELVTMAIVKSNYSKKGDALLLRRDNQNGGALLPLDDTDRETVATARSDANPASMRRAVRDRDGKSRTSAMCDSVRGALAAHPDGMTYRALRAAVQAALGTCGDPALAAALSVLGSSVRTARGPRGATLHFLEGSE